MGGASRSTAALHFIDIGRQLGAQVRLDNAKLIAFLGAEPHTPLDAAVRASLVELGCLPDGGSRQACGAGCCR